MSRNGKPGPCFVDTLSLYLLTYLRISEDSKDIMLIDKKKITATLLIIISILALYGTHLVFQPFYKSIIWSVILGVTFWPVYTWVNSRLKGKSSLSSLIVIIGIILFFLIPSILVIRSLVIQITFAYEAIQPGLPDILDKVSGIIPINQDITLIETIRNNFKNLGNVLITYFTFASDNVLSIIFQLLVTVPILFFLFRDGKGFLGKVKSSKIIPDPTFDIFVKETGDVIIAVLYGVVLTAIIQGVLGGFGFWILGLPAPVLFGTLMFILALIPFAGTPAVWLPAAIWLIYNGEVGKGIFLIIWGVVAISMIDNFLRPYFISKRLGFHGLLSFIGIIGGMIAFGFIGIFLGPLLIAIPLRLFELYLKPEEKPQSTQKK